MVRKILKLDELDAEFKKLAAELPKAGRRILQKAADNTINKAKEFATDRVGHGVGLAGHYHDRFYQELDLHGDEPTIVVGNDAKNPLYNDFLYAAAIETGHTREHRVLLVRNNEVTALGKWAEKKLGFKQVMAKSGNIYFKTPEGKSITRMTVKLPPRFPMRDALLDTTKKMKGIVNVEMKGMR